MIEFTCPDCGKTLRVEAEHAGKKGKCSACRSSVTVPAPEPSDAVLPPYVDESSLREFESDIELAPDEEVILFQKTDSRVPPDAGLSGRFPPSLHLLVTTNRVSVVAKNKAGDVYEEGRPHRRVKAIEVKRGTFYSTIDVAFSEGDEPAFKLDLPPSVKPECVEPIAEHVKKAMPDWGTPS